MSICFGTELFLGLFFLSFMNFYQFVCELLSLIHLKEGWKNVLLRSDHCLSFYFLAALHCKIINVYMYCNRKM